MLAKLMNSAARRFGYEFKKIGERIDTEDGYQIYRYYDGDGHFDYEKYKAAQTRANQKKLANVWVREENIEFLSNYTRETVGEPAFGICHGTRRGKEQEWFIKYLGCEVIGTEISDTAADFPHTIQWDFHEVKPEWVDRTDFIYSNSLDHSYDPDKCLNAWMSCLTPAGICILEHSSGHERAHEVDPFGAHISQMPSLILDWGRGRFSVREIIDAPSMKSSLKYMKYIIIQRV
ncbi:MAG: hypothetical protein KJN78_08375 [Gammaproteobacteria bacterium]|nr:hypothetical protein [Gammaproteobacteria bacterium]